MVFLILAFQKQWGQMLSSRVPLSLSPSALVTLLHVLGLPHCPAGACSLPLPSPWVGCVCSPTLMLCLTEELRSLGSGSSEWPEQCVGVRSPIFLEAQIVGHGWDIQAKDRHCSLDHLKARDDCIIRNVHFSTKPLRAMGEEKHPYMTCVCDTFKRAHISDDWIPCMSHGRILKSHSRACAPHPLIPGVQFQSQESSFSPLHFSGGSPGWSWCAGVICEHRGTCGQFALLFSSLEGQPVAVVWKMHEGSEPDLMISSGLLLFNDLFCLRWWEREKNSAYICRRQPHFRLADPS